MKQCSCRADGDGIASIKTEEVDAGLVPDAD
jgi:hypothetical protein